jgi:hypothetical protein
MNNLVRFGAVSLLAIGLTGCSNFCLRDMGKSTSINHQARLVHAEPVDDAVTPSFDGAKAGPVLENYRKADTRAADQRLLRDVTN